VLAQEKPPVAIHTLANTHDRILNELAVLLVSHMLLWGYSFSSKSSHSFGTVVTA
jgi:hypothetical protein